MKNDARSVCRVDGRRLAAMLRLGPASLASAADDDDDVTVNSSQGVLDRSFHGRVGTKTGERKFLSSLNISFLRKKWKLA